MINPEGLRLTGACHTCCSATKGPRTGSPGPGEGELRGGKRWCWGRVRSDFNVGQRAGGGTRWWAWRRVACNLLGLVGLGLGYTLQNLALSGTENGLQYPWLPSPQIPD